MRHSGYQRRFDIAVSLIFLCHVFIKPLSWSFVRSYWTATGPDFYLDVNVLAHIWFALSTDIVQMLAARTLADLAAGNTGVI